MKDFLKKTQEAITSNVESLLSELDARYKLVKDVVAGLPILVSMERGDAVSTRYDEKHYFIIPYHLSETGFILHTMRSLPENALEVNDLPKRRVFHFPNESYEGTLRKYMLRAARNMAYESHSENRSSLEKARR